MNIHEDTFVNLQKNQLCYLDFGLLTLEEEQRATSDSQTVLYLTLKGDFDGFQEGASGRIADYFLYELPQKSHNILLNFSQVCLYSDMAPILIRKLQQHLMRHGGRVMIVAPPPSVQEVLDFLAVPYVKTEDEALKNFQEDV